MEADFGTPGPDFPASRNRESNRDEQGILWTEQGKKSRGADVPLGMNGGRGRISQQNPRGRIMETECVQSKAGASSGRQSRQGKSQEPCSLGRRQEGNRVF